MKKLLLIALAVFATGAKASHPITQPFEELKPYEHVYLRNGDKMDWTERWFCFAQRVHVIETFTSAPFMRTAGQWVTVCNVEKETEVYKKYVPYNTFIIYYDEE